MTSWNVGDFLFRWTYRYIDGMDVVNNDSLLTDPIRGVKPEVSTYSYHDLSMRWSATDTISVTVGANKTEFCRSRANLMPTTF